MSLSRISTKDFSIFTQTILANDGEYNRLKIIKQRKIVVDFFNNVLPHKEIIISWSEDGKMLSTTATWHTEGYANLAPLPEIPENFDDINGDKQLAIKHVSFYTMPTMDPVLIEVDAIEHFIVTNVGLDDLLKD
jgi:hypothetical protein